jgi:hypothetical protein
MTHMERFVGAAACDAVPLLHFLQVVACGAEAVSHHKNLETEQSNWSYVEHFKMHLYTSATEKKYIPLRGSFTIRFLYLVPIT